MASIIPDSVKSAKNAVMGSGGDKIADLSKEFKDPGEKDFTTTDYGVKAPILDHWLTVSNEDRVGPSLIEEPFSREKISRFDHERIPERVVHARGTGAFGKFTLQESLSDLSFAPVLTDTSRETPVFVRFSTVLGSRGSADTVRDVRGFAVKFYTKEGNWDIVGNNIPVFFIQDAIKFPDIIHAGKPEPHNEVPQAQTAHNNFWDFVFNHTEATHMYMWNMSDRTIPRSYRMMQGFGVNTYTLINADGKRSFVKFHFTPELGVHSLVWDEALKLAGQDPDFHRKDLMEAIDNGAYPKWKFGVQVVSEEDQDNFEFDILDATKVWPEELVPVRYVGELELNRNIDEFFPQTEQAAFCTSHLVPGIGHSDDPLLQGRNFSYFDTQITRLGPNWQELPINRPVCPVMNFNSDGFMRHTIRTSKVNYWPNRFSKNPPAKPEEGAYIEYQQKVEGMKVRMKSKKFREHFKQAMLFYNSLTPQEKHHVLNAFGFELDHCDDPIVYENLASRLADIDLELAKQVSDMVGAKVPHKESNPNHGKKAKGLSQFDFPPMKTTIISRRVAIIISDGYDPVAFTAVKAAVAGSLAISVIIGSKRNEIFAAGQKREAGKGIFADHHLEGYRSTMVDAVFVPGGRESIDALKKNGRAIHWVREAFGHLKAIGASGEGVELLQAAFQLPSVQLSSGSEAVDSYGVVTLNQVKPDTFGETFTIAKEGAGFVGKFLYAISLHRNWDRELDGLNSQVAY